MRDSNKRRVELITHSTLFRMKLSLLAFHLFPWCDQWVWLQPSPGLVHFLFHLQHWSLCAALWRHHWSLLSTCRTPIHCSKPPCLAALIVIAGRFERSRPDSYPRQHYTDKQIATAYPKTADQLISILFNSHCTLQCLSFKQQDCIYMTLQQNDIYATYTPGFQHLCDLSTKQNKSFDRNLSQYPSNIIISEKGKPSQKQTGRWFLYSFCRHHGLYEYVIVSVLLAVLPTCVGHCHLLFWSQTGKQSSNHCGAWSGLSLEDRPELC